MSGNHYSPLCPDCQPGTCLSCDHLSIISSDNTIKIVKTNLNGICTFNVRLNTQLLVSVEDTATIRLSGDGVGNPLSASVKISTNPDNILTVDSTGLLVTAQSLSETPNTKLDSSTTTVTLSGTSNRKIKVDVKVSALPNNYLTVQADGLYVPTPLGGGLSNVSIQDTASIDLQGTGTSGNPLRALVKISADANNSLIIKSDGIFVNPILPLIFKVGDGGSLTATNGTSIYNPVGNPLINKRIIAVFVGNIWIPPSVNAPTGDLAWSFVSGTGVFTLVNGTFITDTVYAILYQ